MITVLRCGVIVPVLHARVAGSASPLWDVSHAISTDVGIYMFVYTYPIYKYI